MQLIIFLPTYKLDHLQEATLHKLLVEISSECN